jgi:hypothetical protein
LVTWEEMLNSDFQFVENIDAMTFDSAPPIVAGLGGIHDPPLPGMTKEL